VVANNLKAGDLGTLNIPTKLRLVGNGHDNCLISSFVNGRELNAWDHETGHVFCLKCHFNAFHFSREDLDSSAISRGCSSMDHCSQSSSSGKSLKNEHDGVNVWIFKEIEIQVQGRVD